MSVALDGTDFVRLLATLGAVVALVDAARRLVAAAGLALARAERAVAIGVVAGALAAVVVQALGFAGALRPLPILVAVAAGSVLAAVAAGRALARRGGAVAVPEETDRLDGATLAVVVAAAGVALALAVKALLLVPVEWDGLSYHLLYPAHFLQQGRLVPVDFGPPHDKAALFPANGEALHALLMSLVRSDLLVAVGMVAWTALFGVAAGALAAALGAAPAAAAAAGAVAATLPTLAARAASSYVEPVLDFALVAAVLFARRAVADERGAPRAALVAGLAAGLAAGTKYVALPLAAALALVLPLGLALGRRPRRVVGGASAAYLGGAVVAGGAWYVRNLLLAGNPVFPSPFLGLPHLERAGLIWEGTSLAASWRELAARDLIGDALFGLPPARAVGLSLGPVALVALAAALGMLVVEAVAARADWRGGQRARAVARAIAPVALLVLATTYVRLPFWGNPGLFRSEVRFAVPAVAIALALAAAGLTRAGAGTRVVAAVGAAAALGQAWVAGVFDGLAPLARGAALVAVPLALAAALALAPVSRRPLRVAARGAALLAAATALHAAWVHRETGREARWLAPGRVFRPFAEAAFAAERARPGAATIAFATSSHCEFLALFTGRRLERRVIAVPVHAGARSAWRYPGGDARRQFDRDYWRRELARAAPDLLVVSRWRAWRELWPPEERWAREAGLPLLFQSADLLLFEVGAERAIALAAAAGAEPTAP